MNRSRIVVGSLAMLLVALCAQAAGPPRTPRGMRSGEKVAVDKRDQAISAADSAFESGKQYAQSGLYDQAIAKFESAIAKYKEAVRIDHNEIFDKKKEFPDRMSVPPQHALALMNIGVCNLQKGKDYHPRGLARLQEAAALERDARVRENQPAIPIILYNLAVGRTLAGNKLDAIDALDEALSLGFKNFDALRSDPDLYELRRIPEWRKTLEKHGVFL